MTSLQVGVGSGNPAQESYVDYLTFSNTGLGVSTTWDFDEAAIPVPSLTGWIGLIPPVLLGLLGIGFLWESGQETENRLPRSRSTLRSIGR